MRVKAFNPQKGIYNFELSGLNTLFHAHPAHEIIISKEHTFSLETEKETYPNVSFAVIAANTIHKLTAQEGTIEVLMFECSTSILDVFLKRYNLGLVDGLFTSNKDDNGQNLLAFIVAYYQQAFISKTDKKRIATCLNYFENTDLDYNTMMADLTAKVNLSESRLSHLFREDIGISLKKYLVWTRLKRAFDLMLKNQFNLYEASLRSGFYDQAHLSKAFKQLLGLNPSEVYNSRTLQD